MKTFTKVGAVPARSLLGVAPATTSGAFVATGPLTSKHSWSPVLHVRAIGRAGHPDTTAIPRATHATSTTMTGDHHTRATATR